MINSIKQDLSFKGQTIPPVYQNVAKSSSVPSFAPATVLESNVQPETTQKPKKSLRTGIINLAKGFNNITNTSGGAIRGAIEGISAGVLVGTIGKNIIQSKNDIFKTIKGTITDVGRAAIGIIKFIPSILTKAPIENLKNIADLPARFVKYMLNKPKGMPAAKSNKILVGLTAAIALGFIAFRTIEGKIAANKKNANIDHALNEGHLPTK